MEILQLKYFYALTQTQHVTRTAEKLHIAQPALTQTIHRLEKELGVKLFQSSGRNIVLTEFGLYLKDRLKPVLNTLDAIPQELEELNNKAHKTLKLNVLAASTVVTDTIIAYKKANDAINFKIVQNSRAEDADITIFTKEIFKRTENMEGECYIFTERIFLAVPNPSELARASSVMLEDTADMEFISLAGSRSLRTICDRFCMHAGFTPNVIFESDSPESVKNLISASMGIGFWPQYTWGQPDVKQMALIPIAEPDCKRDIVIQFHKKEKNIKEVKDYYEFLVKYMEKLRQC